MATLPFKARYTGLLLATAIVVLLIGIGGFAMYQIMFTPIWHEKLPMLNTTGHEITIRDYRNATDPTYESLIRFLSADSTEYGDYVMPGYTCADFAARLHENAEVQGIRCGVVSVILNTSGYECVWSNMSNSLYLDSYFGDSPDRGHAFNVFNTTDRGLVYVDSTGISAAEKARGVLPHDMIVYASCSLELGELWIDQTSDRFDYKFYEQQKELYHSYSMRTIAFNNEVEAYNNDIEAFNEMYAGYDQNATAYAAEFDRYRSQLDDYNGKMSVHNSALAAYNTEVQRYDSEMAQAVQKGTYDAAYFESWWSALARQKDAIPPAPSGGDALERWRLDLLDRLNELDRQCASLQQRQDALDMQRDELIRQKNVLLGDDEASLVIGRPMGVVESISVYW